MKSAWTFLLATLLLTGCATSTVQSRKQERAAAYAALTPELQAQAQEEDDLASHSRSLGR